MTTVQELKARALMPCYYPDRQLLEDMISELESLTNQLAQERIALNALTERFNAMGELWKKDRDRIAELEKDKSRLDFLDSKTTNIQIMREEAGSCGWREFADIPFDGNARDKIDSAMKQTK